MSVIIEIIHGTKETQKRSKELHGLGSLCLDGGVGGGADHQKVGALPML